MIGKRFLLWIRESIQGHLEESKAESKRSSVDMTRTEKQDVEDRVFIRMSSSEEGSFRV